MRPHSRPQIAPLPTTLGELHAPSIIVDEDREWVAHHQRGLWKFLRALGASRPVAEEVLQDALLAGLEHGSRREWTDAGARRWLRATARNLFFMGLRQQSRRQRRERVDSPLVEALEARCESEPEWLDALRACVAALPPRSRRALELRYGEGLDREAIGAAIGVRREGVKTLLQRIRGALRTCIETRNNS